MISWLTGQNAELLCGIAKFLETYMHLQHAPVRQLRWHKGGAPGPAPHAAGGIKRDRRPPDDGAALQLAARRHDHATVNHHTRRAAGRRLRPR